MYSKENKPPEPKRLLHYILNIIIGTIHIGLEICHVFVDYIVFKQ